jgi:hypothetical protein
MKSDLYTKFVLTVIAVALLYLCVAYTIQPTVVQAESPKYSVPTVGPYDTETFQAVPVVVYQASEPINGQEQPFRRKP